MNGMTAPAVRRLRWPLYVSLFLNVVLLTALALGAWNMTRMRDRTELGLGAWMPRQVERILGENEDARRKVHAVREAHRDSFRALFRDARDALDAVRATIDADPFNAEALRAALLAKVRAESAISQKSADMMVEIANVLTPEQRKIVRENIRRHGRGPGEDRGGRPSPDERAPPAGRP